MYPEWKFSSLRDKVDNMILQIQEEIGLPMQQVEEENCRLVPHYGGDRRRCARAARDEGDP